MVCFLMEILLDKEGFVQLYDNLPFPNQIIVKYPDSGGGLALIWKNDVKLEVISFTTNHILAKVKEDDGFEWYLTCFYGWPEANQKEKSWQHLAHLKSFIDGPWLCIGDFNAFLSSFEKLSKHPPQHGQVAAFKEALDLCQLEDLGFRGYHFTWNNKQLGDANTRVRLDRVVATKEWREKFQLSSITHLSSHASNHLPIIPQTKSFSLNRFMKDRKFKFKEFWFILDDCEAMIRVAWDRIGHGFASLSSIKEKIETCGVDLFALGSGRSNLDNEEIKQMQKMIETLNEAKITAKNREEFLVVSKQLDELLLKQEIYRAQRSRIS
ncbi:uncharacterized protein LOC136067422 [Quercus suber]|uniref:uncharacterized protein LOC136067422 n=1 Tax=Quercus suber TaxID=58331 RepID=UPI0032DF0559